MTDNDLNTGPAKPSQITEEELRASLERMQARLNAAKIAYLNRVEWNGKVPEYEDVAAVAKELIALNYQLQRTLYGEVRLKLSVAKLLRASSR